MAKVEAAKEKVTAKAKATKEKPEKTHGVVLLSEMLELSECRH